MSDIVEHARRELEKLGFIPEAAAPYLLVVEAFAGIGLPVADEPRGAQLISELLFRKNLTPITSDPAEWMLLPGSETSLGGEAAAGIWQNKRDPLMFSYDGGKTYYNVEEIRILLEAGSRKTIRVSASSA